MNDFNSNFPEDFEKFKGDFKKMYKNVIPVVGFFILVILGKTSFYQVEPEEEAIVIRLGKYIETNGPGLHFKLPLGIDQAIKLKTKRRLQAEFGFRTANTGTRVTTYSRGNYDDESHMLTGDLNIANVEWVVQYEISDPYKFQFKTKEPIVNVRDVSESIMRRVVGDRLVTDVLTTGRNEIEIEAKKLMQEVINKYDMGIKIVVVKLQDVNPPEKVKASFNEVNAAKQEQEKMINQAETAYNRVIPEARGKAEKLVSQAEGYAAALINRAKGDGENFATVLKAYNRAPAITRKRIYLETMETIFDRMENVTIVDSRVKGLLPVFNKLNQKSE
ncbi:MAG: FtsH protease activity modulator HflK [Halobacteriovoraceae bacterium]|nr:FtsH protease activity modulator HflK [Halobacteriovoraceae bacterium]MBT5092763.1 FtsH protease activity modulator HflK [Halobacteriovoraceae bacterium]